MRNYCYFYDRKRTLIIFNIKFDFNKKEIFPDKNI